MKTFSDERNIHDGKNNNQTKDHFQLCRPKNVANAIKTSMHFRWYHIFHVKNRVIIAKSIWNVVSVCLCEVNVMVYKLAKI